MKCFNIIVILCLLNICFSITSSVYRKKATVQSKSKGFIRKLINFIRNDKEKVNKKEEDEKNKILKDLEARELAMRLKKVEEFEKEQNKPLERLRDSEYWDSSWD